MMTHQDISSTELQLLLSSCKELLYPNANRGLVETFLSKVDYNKLLRLIRRHQIAPVIYQSLKDFADKMSPGFSHELRGDIQRIQLKALSTKAFLYVLNNKLKEKEIELFLLKGIALAEKYYGDIGLRDVMDLDLLVEPQNLDTVIQLLQELGYSISGEYSTFSNKQKEFVKYIDYHFGFSKIKEGHPRYVELHWALRNRFGNFVLDPFICKQEKSTQSIVNQEYLLELSEIDNFLFLCTHGAEHAFYRLKWLVDIYMVYNKIDIDFNDLVERSISLQCSEQLVLSFKMMEIYFAIPIPDQILQLSKKYKISQWLVNYCTHQIMYNGQYCDSLVEKMRNLRFSFIMNRKGIFNKRLFMRYMTSPKDWSILPLPNSLFFLYFPLRPFLFLYRILTSS